MIDNWPDQDFSIIFAKFGDRISQLSIQKFSSHVVEKAFETAVPELKSYLIRQLASVDRLMDLMMNNFGNYVVQRALSLAQEEDLEIITEAIWRNLPNITQKKI